MLKNLKNTTLILIVLMGLLIFNGVSAETVKINGTVNDLYNNPVEKAEVKIYDLISSTCGNGTCPLAVQFTDANGYFWFSVNATDYDKTYNIAVKKQNYETKTVPITITNLNNNFANQSLNIQIKGIANVSGILMDKDSGMAIKNARITIMDKGTTTNEGGEFLTENVTAETTSIKVEHDGYETQSPVYDLTAGRNFIKLQISKQYTSKEYAVSVFTNYPALIFGTDDIKKFTVNVKNIGNMDATYKLEITNINKNLQHRILNDKDERIPKIFVRSGEAIKIFVEVKTPENIAKGEYKFNLSVGSDEVNNKITLIADVSGTTGSYGFEPSSAVRGRTVSAGQEVKFEISIQNNASSDIYKLNASVPYGWKYYIADTQGSEITEVEVTKDHGLNINFKITPPSDENAGIYELNLTIESSKGKEIKTVSFKVTVRQEKEIYEVEISSPYSTKSAVVGEAIEYSLSIQNKGRAKDNYNLAVEELPAGWTYKFKESSGNSPQISSAEVDTGATKSIVLQINPSTDATIGEYKFKINVYGKANTTLNASILISGSNEMKFSIDNSQSIQIESGQEGELTIKVQNTGLSELRDVELDVTKPTGWDVSVVPSKIAALPSQTTGKFTLKIKPPVDASIYDHKVIIKAKSAEVETSEDQIRVTVTKSAGSGYLGYAIIGIAIIILVIIFKKFGRK